ncbi:hypothetical protein A2867_00795 [Candidatus Daviesbacteria bacterium RIFCSPHIGHO2_01_FULL_40_11]|uniref:Uncharacterized protein n=1 Tax=Candidatus Daviesbacteria bacterium RIFCSPHIGHO2_01_FULL_40_11 TaxID=1797762 RepID=A0A1F5JLK0_9BACT|nr:MAG: hypothetical protein A2867_00795 [Candidatus Daviesbacteria bacterium RIFCSPHIGHO2_01_FULL_40_11]
MQKGSATLFLLVGLVIAVSIGIFSFRLLKLPIPSSLPVPQVSQAPAKTSIPDPKILTYANQALGFEFEYPKDFSVKEDSEEQFNKRGNGDFRKNFKGYVGYEPAEVLGAVVVLEKEENYGTNPFALWVFDNPENLTTDGWFDKYWYYPFLWGVFDYTSKGHIALDQEATISGKMAKYKIVSYQPGSPKFIYISKDKKMYLFRAIGEVGEKILSSFKFLNNLEDNGFICPKTGWENCMPILTPEAQKQCSKEAIEWKEANCPNFQGVAQ